MDYLKESPTFPYAIGVLQSKARGKLNRLRFAVNDKNHELISKTKRVLEDSLGREVYEGVARYSGDGGITKRVVVWSSDLMAYLNRITNGNTIVPEFLNIEQEENYLRGWFDSRLCVSYHTWEVHELRSSFKRPKLAISKRDNPFLLRKLGALLERHFFRPRVHDHNIYLNRHEEIAEVLNRGLLTVTSKVEKLDQILSNFAFYRLSKIVSC